MQTKDDIKGMAQTFREAADILDEIADLDDKGRHDARGKKRERRRTVSKILAENDQDSAGINSRKGNRHE